MYDGIQGEERRREFLLLRVDGCVHPFRVEQLVWATSEDNYVRLRSTNGQEYLARRTLTELETELGYGPFVRIHRSTLVNLRFVDRLVPWFSGGYVVRLTTGDEFKLSKGYAATLFARFGPAS